MPWQDDPSISGDRVLYRRIPPWGGRVKWAEDGTPTPSSQNFKDPNDELSVFLEDKTTIEAILEGEVNAACGVIRFRAQRVRDLLGASFIISLDEPPPGHVVICGRVTGGLATRLKRDLNWEWVPGRWPTRFPPDAVPPDPGLQGAPAPEQPPRVPAPAAPPPPLPIAPAGQPPDPPIASDRPTFSGSVLVKIVVFVLAGAVSGAAVAGWLGFGIGGVLGLLVGGFCWFPRR